MLTSEELRLALRNTKDPQVVERQKLRVRYDVEDPKTEDRPRRFLDAFASVLKHTNYRVALDHYFRTNARCGRCSTQCQIYEATGDPKDIPCYRSEKLLSVYRRHFTISGILRGRILGDPGLTDETIQELAESLYNCTGCQRCRRECPMGIDHSLVTHLGRYILSEIGIAPRALVNGAREQLDGNSREKPAIAAAFLTERLAGLTRQIESEKGLPIQFPVDQAGAEYLLATPKSDFIADPGSLKGIAAVFRATGDSWTLGTGCLDGNNYGLFYNDQVLQRGWRQIEAEAQRLEAEKVVIGESGAASQAANLLDGVSLNIIEYTHQAWKQGRITFKSVAIHERVTYHDPCYLARSRWIVEQPRELLRACCGEIAEMTPNRQEAVCCGGGGGAAMIDEIRPYRTVVGGKSKAEQIRATGARICVAPCADCRKQLRELVEDQGIDCEIVGLHELLYRALRLDGETGA